jgi:hypothetical protein
MSDTEPAPEADELTNPDGSPNWARGVPRSFIGGSEEAARVLVFMVPAGLAAALADPERFGEVFESRHVKVVGPPSRCSAV